VKRRRFLGQSVLFAAASSGITTFSLSSCKKNEDSKFDYEAIVIGSGFGGSVAALRLSEKGIKTLLIEWGKFYDNSISNHVFSPTLPPDKRSTWLKNKTELPFGINLSWKEKYVGVLDRVEFQNMNVYRNICLGGGSISNGGVLLKPTAEHFKKFMFNDIDFNELNNYYNKVQNMLSATQMPDDLFNSSYYKFAQIAKLHATNAGLDFTHALSFYDFEKWRKETLGEIPKSALIGELLYGNNNNIKNTLDKNYLALALGTGNLTIKTLTRVDDIAVSSDGTYKLNTSTIDENGNSYKFQNFKANHVFVCAGSVGSTSLLVESREKGLLPDLETSVGKFWGPNGNSFAVRKVKENTGAMHSSPPTLSILDFNNPITPVAAMQDIFPIGFELNILLMVGQPYIETRGEFIYDTNLQKAILSWSKNGLEQGTAGMRSMIDKLNTANNSEIDTNFIKEGVSDSFTYHPLGGVVLGKASDNYGRLKGYKNLYCLDGAMLPGNCAMVNPTFTITALAERNMDTILKENF
jgi:cholesterol oxidase